MFIILYEKEYTMGRKKGVKLNYYNLYRKKFSEGKRLINKLSKAGYTIDVEYYQDILATQNTDYKQGYQTLKELLKRTEVMSKAYKIDEQTGLPINITNEVFDRITEVPRSYEFDSTEQYQSGAPYYAEIAVRNFKFELQVYESLIVNKTSADGESKVTEWFNNLLDTYGVTKVGKMLMDASEHGIQLGFEVMYDSTSATNFINEMMSFLDTSDMVSDENLKDIQTEINDSERIMEDEDGTPII